MKSQTSKLIVFITGAFISHHCWDDWVVYFQRNGYTTLAPPWPFKNDSAESLRNRRNDTHQPLNQLVPLTEYFAEIVQQLPEKPILIGHSTGGLIVQLLLQRGLGAIGVAIHSVPPQGVVKFKLAALMMGWRPLGLLTLAKRPFLMTFVQWQNAVANGMSIDEQKEGYYKLAIPESGLIIRDTFTSAAKVDFKKPHNPLLFISGRIDKTIPAYLNYENYRKYKDVSSVTNYTQYEESNHLVLGQSNWKEKAAYILEWIKRQQIKNESYGKFISS